MSFRIDRMVGDDEIVVLGISGRITRQDLDTLRALLEAETGAVAISLENVGLIDREVVKYLAQRELDGTVLRDCSAYIREWVTRDQAELMKNREDTDDT